MTDRLYRSRDDRMLAGVAGGVADMLDADPSIIRVLWVVLIFLTGGLALLVYIVMAIVIPERPAGSAPWGPSPAGVAGTPPASTSSAGAPPSGSPDTWIAPDGSTVPIAAAPSHGPRHRDPADRARGGLVIGLFLIVIGGLFLIRQVVPAFDLGLVWPLVAIGLGVALVVVAITPPRHSG